MLNKLGRRISCIIGLMIMIFFVNGCGQYINKEETKMDKQIPFEKAVYVKGIDVNQWENEQIDVITSKEELKFYKDKIVDGEVILEKYEESYFKNNELLCIGFLGNIENSYELKEINLVDGELVIVIDESEPERQEGVVYNDLLQSHMQIVLVEITKGHITQEGGWTIERI